MLPVRGWVPPGEGGKKVWTPASTGLAALGLSDYALHAFATALQGVVAAGVSAELRQNLENRGESLESFWSPGTRGGQTHALSTLKTLPAWTSLSATPSHARLPAKGVVPTGGRGQQVLTLKTINIILKTSPPASTICPALFLTSESNLVPGKVEQSSPCPKPPVPTQHPATYASTLKTIKITLKTVPPFSTSRLGTLLPPSSTSSRQCGVRPRSFLPP